jgi:hypothetical protein
MIPMKRELHVAHHDVTCTEMVPGQWVVQRQVPKTEYETVVDETVAKLVLETRIKVVQQHHVGHMPHEQHEILQFVTPGTTAIHATQFNEKRSLWAACTIVSQDLEDTKSESLCALDADACLICMATDTATLAMECCGNGINCEKKKWCFACIEKQNWISKAIPRCPFCRAMLPVSMAWALLAQRYMAQSERETPVRPPQASAAAAPWSRLMSVQLGGVVGLSAGLAMVLIMMSVFMLVIYAVMVVFNMD